MQKGYLIAVLALLPGCTASLNQKRGYDDGVAMQEGKVIQRTGAVDYAIGFQKSYDPKDIEARQKAKKEAEEALISHLESEAARIMGEQETIKNTLCGTCK